MTDTTKPEHKLRIELFLPAFILAPLIWAAVPFWIYYVGLEASLGVLEVPVGALAFAPFFGGIPYVLFGGPIMWYWAARAYPTAKHMSLAAVIAVVVSMLFVLAFSVIMLMFSEADFDEASVGSLVFTVAYTGFGVPVAALWGATVSVIYQRLDRWFPVRAAD
ncbi:MAG: hypothetical protein CMM86_03785 [Rhodovulum sp.]|nr:hypothetical protein [Rhodovulum sp.]|tara:strand:- start:8 stop:496 length:489 start_codon:yes stop_codon:yes gene_type:complete